MELFHASNWPLLAIAAAMIAAAVIDWWKFKVPNRLTFPIIVSGWLLGLLHNAGIHLAGEVGVGGIGASLVGTAIGFGLLLPMYAIGGMGAGDVKMTMGFGAWAGAFFGYEAFWVILAAFCAGAVSGGLIALAMMAVRRQFQDNLQHTRAILMDLVTTGSIRLVAEKAHQRRPRWHRLPYGVPLCIGFVGYLWLWGSQQLPSAPHPEAQVTQQTTALTQPAEIFPALGDGRP